MSKWSILLIVLVLANGLACTRKAVDMKISNLRCEYLKNPLGIDMTHPRLSWVLESSKRNQKQTAYRILVAGSKKDLDKDNGNFWDTLKVISDQTTHIFYNGSELISGRKYWWKVCVWDKDGVMCQVSEPAFWSMGLLSNSDWRGKWIGMQREKSENSTHPDKIKELSPGPPPPFFRKTFTLDKKVYSAYVHVTARGLFEVHLNGDRVSKDYFAPEWTDYTKRIQYRTYDVISLLKEGKNALGVIVGDGWYSGYIGWRKNRGHYGLQNSLLLQMEIVYDDGTRDFVVTDGTWRCSDGPILYSDFMIGESYDARREMLGWDTAQFDDSDWSPVIQVEKPTAKLVAQPSEPVQVTEYITPVAITEPSKGLYVFDLGQNIAGWVKLKVTGPDKKLQGTIITMRFAERLNPDGTIYTANLRSVKATDTYILKGGEEETFEPHFTFHGYQYVEVTGLPVPPDKNTITGCVVHSTTPPTGNFECSSSMVNKLWQNLTWSQRGNFISIPTDCPQRDERLGWMGDAQIFVRTATFNMDVAAFFTKWMIDVVDAQSLNGAYADTSPRLKDNLKFEAAPGWGDAGIIIPWTFYRVYGDTRIIEKTYHSMVKWMDFLEESNPELIRRNKLGNNYGDWLSIKAETPKDLLATAYWAYDAKLMSEMARVAGYREDSSYYKKLYNKIRTTFQKEFISPDGRIHGNTQTVYVLALNFDLVPQELRSKAVEYLVEDIKNRGWHLSTGFIGVRHLNPVLTSMGYKEVAYKLLLNNSFPSWGYSIKHGATTIWERWDGWTEDKGFQDPGMNSFNHYSFGSIGEWLYRFVAGIDLDPKVHGYKHIVIKPYPGGNLTFARAEYNSIHGKITSGWHREGNSIVLDVTIPANTTASVHVPADEGTPITESGLSADEVEGIRFLKWDNGFAVYNIVSGTYHFMSTLSN